MLNCFRRDCIILEGNITGMDARRQALLLLSVLCMALALLDLVSPFLAPYGSFRGLDGTAGMIDGGSEGHGAVSAVYAIGDVLCHQELERSFVLNGSQMPVCMRCTGIVLGAAVGFASVLLLRGRYSRNTWIPGIILVLLMLVEWAVETTGFDSPLLRTLSGFGAGTGVALVVYSILYREPDDTLPYGEYRVRDRTAAGRRLAGIGGVPEAGRLRHGRGGPRR